MPDAFARLLRRMMEVGSAPRSQFSARSLKELQSLFDAGALHVKRSAAGFVIEVRDPETLATYYRNRYPSEGSVIGGPPRALAVGMLRNAKRVRRTDREPVLIRAIRPAVCFRAEACCDLYAATKLTGAACLILEQGRFWSLETGVAIVENLESFLHFEDMAVDADIAVYASGRLSDLALQWLGSPEMQACRFIHCGDYDPVGLDEFLRLKAVAGDRVLLHRPLNLHELVSTYGRPELLRDARGILKRLRGSNDPDVRQVVKILDQTGCGLEQEALLIDAPHTWRAHKA